MGQDLQAFEGGYPSAETLTRHKLLDAGIRCIAKYGAKKTNMRLIAEESGIVRQTVYNYFSSKKKLLAEALLREGEKLGADGAKAIATLGSAEEEFVQGFLYIHDELPANPILRAAVDPAGELAREIGLFNYPFEELGGLLFKDSFERYPQLKPAAASICELWVRCVLSFITQPGEPAKNRDELETFVRERMVPGLGITAAPAAVN